jgi:hypothetical protein
MFSMISRFFLIRKLKKLRLKELKFIAKANAVEEALKAFKCGSPGEVRDALSDLYHVQLLIKHVEKELKR